MPRLEQNGGPYEVRCSGVVAKALRRLQRQASLEGRGDALISAFREVVQRLTHDPDEFGEALYRLPALRTQVRSAVIRPLVVHFAICEAQPVVFIKGVELLGRGTA